jgi:hypothetical protein
MAAIEGQETRVDDRPIGIAEITARVFLFIDLFIDASVRHDVIRTL